MSSDTNLDKNNFTKKFRLVHILWALSCALSLMLVGILKFNCVVSDMV